MTFRLLPRETEIINDLGLTVHTSAKFVISK